MFQCVKGDNMVHIVLAQGLCVRYEGPSEKSIASGTRVFQRNPFKALEMSCFDPVLTITSIQDHHIIKDQDGETPIPQCPNDV